MLNEVKDIGNIEISQYHHMDGLVPQTVRPWPLDECSICCSEIIEHENCVFNPCGHSTTCLNCLVKLRRHACPICRSNIRTVTTSCFLVEGIRQRTFEVSYIIGRKKSIQQHALLTVPTVLFVGADWSRVINQLKEKYPVKKPIREESFFSSEFHPNVELLGGRIPIKFLQYPSEWPCERRLTTADFQTMFGDNFPMIATCVKIQNDATEAQIAEEFKRIGNAAIARLRGMFGQFFKALCFVVPRNVTVPPNSNWVKEGKIIEILESVLKEDKPLQENMKAIVLHQPTKTVNQNISNFCNSIICLMCS